MFPQRKCETFVSIIFLSLILIVSQVKLDSESDSSSMKCICDGNCERVEESECPWGLTLDVCACCFICARGENEPCGGPSGNCAIGLTCELPATIDTTASLSNGAISSTPGKEIEVGTCKSSISRNCTSAADVVEKFGCIVHFGKCVCQSWKTCITSYAKLFLFDTEVECKERIAFLIATQNQIVQRRQPQLKLVKLPQNLSHMEKGDVANADVDVAGPCSDVKCSELPTVCPTDSHRNPIIINQYSNSNHESQWKFSSAKHAAGIKCCPNIEDICQCNPPSACAQKPTCSALHSSLIIKHNGTSQPGMCCPVYECKEFIVPVSPAVAAGEEVSACWFKGIKYNSNESWTNVEDCSECKCVDGLFKCKSIHCKHPENCRRILPQPPNLTSSVSSSSCCPVCSDCISNSGIEYSNSDVWQEDVCTTCKCNQGRRQCHATLCVSSCMEPKVIEGECCPQCDEVNSTKNILPAAPTTELPTKNSSYNQENPPQTKLELHLIIISLGIVCCLIVLSLVICILLLRYHGNNHNRRRQLRHKTTAVPPASIPMAIPASPSSYSASSNYYCYNFCRKELKKTRTRTPLQSSTNFSESGCDSEKTTIMDSV